MHKHNIAIAIGVDKVKAGKAVQAQCIAPLLKILCLIHGQPLLHLAHLAHTGVAYGIGAVVGLQRRAVG